MATPSPLPRFKPNLRCGFASSSTRLWLPSTILICLCVMYIVHKDLLLTVCTSTRFMPPYPSNGASMTSEALKNCVSDECVVSLKRLKEVWTTVYSLDLPYPDDIDIENLKEIWSVPPAPHLKYCPLVTQQMNQLEFYNSTVGYPVWAVDTNINGVKPPWIRGADEDNLPLTRLTQRDIWLNQNPLDCKSPYVKFVVTKWLPEKWHGLGSQLHVMSYFFAMALATDRVFVPYTSSFERTKIPNCKNRGYGSLNCYFFPMVSRECEKQAMLHLWKNRNVIKINPNKTLTPQYLTDIFKSKEKVVFFEETAKNLFFLLDRFPERFSFPKYRVSNPIFKKKIVRTWKSEPWKNSHQVAEILSRTSPLSQRTKFRIWILAQIVRYMLRWPSLYLCHKINQERHTVYGSYVMNQILEAEERQKRNKMGDVKLKTERLKLKELGGFSANNWANLELTENILRSPYIMHPIISLHVRQGDKKWETRLYPPSAFMYFAEKMRYSVPDLKYVWLSTESESVINKLKDFTSWTFLYTDMPRLNGTTPIHKYEQEIGTTRFMDSSFVNLIISSECDYFVGTLSSNWNLLINELRMTNGNIDANYVSFDIMDKLVE